MDPRRGNAQIIASGAALAAAYEIREGFFEDDLVLFAVFVVMHATIVVMSVMMFLRAWREIEEFDGPLVLPECGTFFRMSASSLAFME